MDTMNIDTLSLLGRFGDFGCLVAIQYYRIDIGKEMAYRKLKSYSSSRRIVNCSEVQPSGERISAENVRNMLQNRIFVSEDSYKPRPHTLVNREKNEARPPSISFLHLHLAALPFSTRQAS